MSAAARTRVASFGAPEARNPFLSFLSETETTWFSFRVSPSSDWNSASSARAPPPGVQSATAASVFIADTGETRSDAFLVRSRNARFACVAATGSPSPSPRWSTKRSRSPSRPPPFAAAARATAPASRSHRCFRVCAAARRSAGRPEASEARRRGTSLAGVATLGAKSARCCTYVAASWRHAASPASDSRNDVNAERAVEDSVSERLPSAPERANAA